MPATAISTNDLAALIVDGLHEIFGDNYKMVDYEYTKIFETVRAMRAEEIDQEILGFSGAYYKPEGTGINYQGVQQGYKASYKMRTYAIGMMITEEMLEDDRYGKASQIGGKGLVKALRYTKEREGASVLNQGFSTNRLIGDGQPLFSNAHPTVKGISQSNILPVNADISEDSVEDILTMIEQAKGPVNEKIALMARALVVHPSKKFDAKRILGSPMRPGSMDNDINVLNDENYIPGGVISMRYLTDPDLWFITTDCEAGLRHFRRRRTKHGSEGDFNTGNLKYKASERYAFGATNWRAVYGSRS